MMRLRRIFALLVSISGPAYAADGPVRTIILVRHAAYDEAARDNDHASLTPLGVAQALLLAARLQTLPKAPTELVASTMGRALQTEAIIHAAMPSLPNGRSDLLRECTPPGRDLKFNTIERTAARVCARQLNQAFGAWFRPVPVSETTILVCHGNVIRYLVMKALGAEPRLWVHFSIGHTSVTKIEVRADGSMRVLTVGDVGHLPPNLQSGTERETPALIAPQL